MDELIQQIKKLKLRLKSMLEALKVTEQQSQLNKLNHLMTKEDFWLDRKNATKVSQQAAAIEQSVSFWQEAERRLMDLESLAKADQADQSVNMLQELEQELFKLKADVDTREVEVWFSGEYDKSAAILTIYSGAGGVDAQDWAEMLERMYLRLAEIHGWPAKMMHRTTGHEAGIKNVTIRFGGMYAYGYLKAEAGVHRLVRISPYDADQARHTSFAMVEVLPELDQSTLAEIDDEDVRVDVFRASGHGGQSVNTTDSAVRLTHLSTGITVICQNERSQMQNKEQAWKMLLGKLAKYFQAKKEEERQLLRGEFTENAWGSQIRSYVLHPYKMVKDHRTKYEVKNPEEVLDGGLMPFIEAELRRQAS